MSNISRHKILKALSNVYFKNQDLKEGSVLRKIGTSLSFNYILKETKLSENKLKENLRYLILNGEVTNDGNEEDKISFSYSVTPNGVKKFYSKYYFYSNWFMNKPFIISIISVLIALGSSIANYNKLNDSYEKMRNIEKRLEKLEKRNIR